MIGIAFLTVIGLWIAFAVFSGRKVAAWLDRQDPPRAWLRYAWMTFFVFLPVMDEVIAYPQVMLICQKAKDSFWYDKTTARKKSETYSTKWNEYQIKIFPGINLHQEESIVTLPGETSPALRSTKIKIGHGYLNFPDGSGSRAMPLILPSECPSRRWRTGKWKEASEILNLK